MGREEEDWNRRYNEVWGQEMDEDRPIRISDPSLLDDSYKGRYVKGGTYSQSKNDNVRKVEKSIGTSGAGKGKLVIFVLLIIFCAVVTIVAVNSDENTLYDSEYEEDYYDDEDDYGDEEDYEDADDHTDMVGGLSYSVPGEWERNEDDEADSFNYYKDDISLNVYAVDSDADIEDEELKKVYKESMEDSGNTVTKTEDLEIDGSAAYVIYSTYRDEDNKDFEMNYKTVILNGDDSIVEFICGYYDEDKEEAIEAFDDIIDSISS